MKGGTGQKQRRIEIEEGGCLASSVRRKRGRCGQHEDCWAFTGGKERDTKREKVGESRESKGIEEIRDHNQRGDIRPYLERR